MASQDLIISLLYELLFFALLKKSMIPLDSSFPDKEAEIMRYVNSTLICEIAFSFLNCLSNLLSLCQFHVFLQVEKYWKHLSIVAGGGRMLRGTFNPKSLSKTSLLLIEFIIDLNIFRVITMDN